MVRLPSSTATLLVRTGFQDEQAWREVVAAATVSTEYTLPAVLLPVDDPQFVGCTDEQLLAAAAENDLAGSAVLFVADTETMASPDNAVLVLIMDSPPGVRESFRCVPGELSAVENDLNIGNLDWDDFAESAVEQGGIYHGLWAS